MSEGEIGDMTGVLHEDVQEQLNGINDTMDILATIDENLSIEEEYKVAYDILSKGFAERAGDNEDTQEYLDDIWAFIAQHKITDDPKIHAHILAAQDLLRDREMEKDK